MLKYKLVLEIVTFGQNENIRGSFIYKLPLTDAQNLEMERLTHTFTMPTTKEQIFMDFESSPWEDLQRISGLHAPVIKTLHLEAEKIEDEKI